VYPYGPLIGEFAWTVSLPKYAQVLDAHGPYVVLRTPGPFTCS
jgi:hypothetical protein